MRVCYVAVLLGCCLVTTSAQCQTVPPPGLVPGDTYHLLFVTSTRYGIGTPTQTNLLFNSLPSADGHVTLEAAVARLPGAAMWQGGAPVYTAILSDDHTNARDRVAIEGPVYNTRGDLLATGFTDLWDGSLANSVDFNAFGQLVDPVATIVFTGSLANGTSSGQDCEDWSGGESTATVGRASTTSGAWLNSPEPFPHPCESGGSLYALSPALTVALPGDFNGDQTVNLADYTVWRDNLGGPDQGIYLNGAGDGSPLIGMGDYQLWKASFGNSVGPALASSTAIPTPSSQGCLLLCLVAWLVVVLTHRQRPLTPV